MKLNKFEEVYLKIISECNNKHIIKEDYSGVESVEIFEDEDKDIYVELGVNHDRKCWILRSQRDDNWGEIPKTRWEEVGGMMAEINASEYFDKVIGWKLEENN